MKNKQKLTSVLKNVPHELRAQIMKYQTKNSFSNLRWKARQPVEGKKYGHGGSLKFEDAKSADLYVDKEDIYYGKWLEEWESKGLVIEELQKLKKDFFAEVNEKTKLRDKYEALLLETSFKDIKNFLDETPAPTRKDLFNLQRRVESMYDDLGRNKQTGELIRWR
tara:strand:- start:859 stop:1353 length:495 start_codon:yes stop_codon:yes gene_type:complete